MFWVLWKVPNHYLWLCEQQNRSTFYSGYTDLHCVDKNSVWSYGYRNGFLSPHDSNSMVNFRSMILPAHHPFLIILGTWYDQSRWLMITLTKNNSNCLSMLYSAKCVDKNSGLWDFMYFHKIWFCVNNSSPWKHFPKISYVYCQQYREILCLMISKHPCSLPTDLWALRTVWLKTCANSKLSDDLIEDACQLTIFGYFCQRKNK